MQWYEILIVVAIGAFCIAVVTWQIIRKVKGKGGCSECSGCSGCKYCSSCSSCKSKQSESDKK